MTRPELIEICKELGLDCNDLTHKELKEFIKNECDKRFNKRYNISANKLSKGLKKFLTIEYNYIIKDKDNNEYNYKGDTI